MMIHFDDLAIFVLAVDNGSLSAAIRVLNITPATASIVARRSETELGMWLLARSTRNLALTQEGERRLQHARRVLADLQAGQDVFILGHQAIGGDVSLLIPSDLGRNVLTGWFGGFLTEYPAVTLQARIGGRLIGIFRQRADATVCYGEPEDSSLVALPLMPDNYRVLCAAPTYSARHGVPKTPGNLRRHNCLLLALSNTTHDQWTFHGTSDGDQAHVVCVTGDRIVDDSKLVRRWTIAEHGIAYKSRLDVLADLCTGRL